MVRFINRIITHNRDTEGDFGIRVLIHIPIGILIGIPFIGRNIKDLFIRYEENEDLHTKDQAWKDYAGAMVGAAITTVVVAIIVIIIVWRLLW